MGLGTSPLPFSPLGFPIILLKHLPRLINHPIKSLPHHVQLLPRQQSLLKPSFTSNTPRSRNFRHFNHQEIKIFVLRAYVLNVNNLITLTSMFPKNPPNDHRGRRWDHRWWKWDVRRSGASLHGHWSHWVPFYSYGTSIIFTLRVFHIRKLWSCLGQSVLPKWY